MIEIGGKRRRITYNFNAWSELTELTGIDIFSNWPEKFKAAEIRALAFVGLKHGAIDNSEKVDFTLEDVGRWLTPSLISEFFKAAGEQNDAGRADEGGKKSGEQTGA